ncbi:MAG: GatB/YqeY domain-containing protein [Bacilli bacterium]|nr:GatB/YqeY domain-containing protein [Bacilli bacterium]
MVEKLKQDMVEAMKNKEKERLTVIRMVKAAMDQEHIDRKREINDELLIDVVNKQIKMRKDSIAEFDKAGRTDLSEKTQSEVDMLMAYLPEQLSSEEVVKIIDEIFAEVKPEGQKDMGKVMKEATAKLKGKADMKEVSNIIKEKLQ